MIRLFGYYGSLQRDIDVMLVADDVNEAIEFSSIYMVILDKVDLNIYTTDQFLKNLNEDPFLFNVYLNGKWIIKNLGVYTNKERIMKRARELYEKLCKEKRKTQDIAYFYLISKGIFPKDRYEIIKITGMDPKDDPLRFCKTY